MERDRLHRDLVTKLEQLNASRLRIVRAETPSAGVSSETSTTARSSA